MYLKPKHIFSNSDYAAAATENSVFILGGYGTNGFSTIAQFKNEEWSNVGNLNKARVENTVCYKQFCILTET